MSAAGKTARNNPAVAAYREEVFTLFPYREGAKDWLRTVEFEVEDLRALSGGGYWEPARRLVHLNTAQYEAAIHEIAHAWWHDRRIGLEEAMMAVTSELAEEPDPRFGRLQRLAYGYINGIPAQNWAGMLVERNDWEMFAGLASGMMADLRLIPDYVRPLYAGMYYLLPPGAPSPESLAPHR